MKEPKSACGLLYFFLAFSVLFCQSSTAMGAQTENQKPVKVLSGEQLYAINCSRCHSERYPTERTEAQWQTIMMHMRVRANISADQAKKILKYLKENN